MPDSERTELGKHLSRQCTFPVQKKRVVESHCGNNLRHYRIELCFRLRILVGVFLKPNRQPDTPPNQILHQTPGGEIQG
jgi:hypothetical protein